MRPPLRVSSSDKNYSIRFNVWALSDLLEFLIRCRNDFRISFGLESVVCAENEVILILMKTVEFETGRH